MNTPTSSSRAFLKTYSHIGKRPAAKLEAPDFFVCLERMQKRGVLETARRIMAPEASHPHTSGRRMIRMKSHAVPAL
jgi:hypothetical protein